MSAIVRVRVVAKNAWLGVSAVLDYSCQVQCHPLAERGEDLYIMPDPAVPDAGKDQHLPRVIWEPARPGRRSDRRDLPRAQAHHDHQ